MGPGVARNVSKLNLVPEKAILMDETAAFCKLTEISISRDSEVGVQVGTFPLEPYKPEVKDF